MITAKQRVQAALEGKILDRPAFVGWGPHMNLVDRNAKDFARATIDYQRCYHFDLIKIMPNGMYFPEAFGQKLKDAAHILDETCKNTLVYRINDPHQWAKIRVPSMKTGAFAREIEVVKRVADYFQGDVPVLATVFSPFVWMGEMTAGFSRQEVIVEQFRDSEKYCKIGLEVVSETNEILMDEFVKAGADGFFLGYQLGMAEKMGRDMFEAYGKKYDLHNIETIKDRTWFNMAHVCHGDAALSEWFLDYPAQAINWADQDAAHHSMKEMRALTDKVLVGGLTHAYQDDLKDISEKIQAQSDLSGADRETVKARVKAKVKTALRDSGKRTIISGGCLWNLGDLTRFPLWEEVMEEVGAEINAGRFEVE